MEALLKVATQLNAGKHHSIRNDDVFVDRLNHRYTVTMILCFAAIVTTTQYFGVSIYCWVKQSAGSRDALPCFAVRCRSQRNSKITT